MVAVSRHRTFRLGAHLIHSRGRVLVIVVAGSVARSLAHACVSKSIENIHVACREHRLGCVLQHRVGEGGNSFLDLAEKERKIAMVAISDEGEDVQDLVEALARPRNVWAGCGLHGQYFCQCGSNGEELLNQTQTREAEIARQVRHHGEKIATNVHRRGIRREPGFALVGIRHAELPRHILQPRLIQLKFPKLRLCVVEVSREVVLKLLLHCCQVGWRGFILGLVPDVDERIVIRAERVDLGDEGVEVDRRGVGRVVGRGREIDASLKAQGTPTLQSIRTGGISSATNTGDKLGVATYRSVAKRSQYRRRRLAASTLSYCK